MRQGRKRAGEEGEPPGPSRPPAAPGRGRPPKFGRPSRVVGLTLPRDVLEALATLHRDPGWAIVRLVESLLGGVAGQRHVTEPKALAEVVPLPGRRGLILVQPQPFGRLRGISTIPLADGRAFLAFDQGAGLADLEVAVRDRLEASPLGKGERADLMQILEIVRGWRRDRRLTFRTKSIIVVEGLAGREHALPPVGPRPRRPE